MLLVGLPFANFDILVRSDTDLGQDFFGHDIFFFIFIVLFFYLLLLYHSYLLPYHSFLYCCFVKFYFVMMC